MMEFELFVEFNHDSGRRCPNLLEEVDIHRRDLKAAIDTEEGTVSLTAGCVCYTYEFSKPRNAFYVDVANFMKGGMHEYVGSLLVQMKAREESFDDDAVEISALLMELIVRLKRTFGQKKKFSLAVIHDGKRYVKDMDCHSAGLDLQNGLVEEIVHPANLDEGPV